MSADDETLKVYDEKASEYANILGADPVGNAALQAFIARLPSGAEVLDLGCGPGTWAALMAQAGMNVDAWDASEGMVALAGEKPGVRARQARFEDLTHRAAYDAVWANFSLLHAPKADMPRHLVSIARALRPGGLAHFGLKSGNGEARDSLGRFYSYFEPEPFCAQLREAGLTPGPVRTGADKGLDGTVAPWFTVQAIKEA